MNDRAKALRAVLKKRGLTIKTLADIAGVGYFHLVEILAARRKAGPRTWERVRRATGPAEQRVIVANFGNVFGENWVDEPDSPEPMEAMV